MGNVSETWQNNESRSWAQNMTANGTLGAQSQVAVPLKQVPGPVELAMQGGTLARNGTLHAAAATPPAWCIVAPWHPLCWQPAPQPGRGSIMTLYHQTGSEAGESILRTGFRAGRVGLCGGGIYFAETALATYTKAVGPDSQRGFIIEARVDLGRIARMSRLCTSPSFPILDGTPVADHLREHNADSLAFNPGDGMEHIIADSSRVLSMRRYP